jgi:hypothetical protein
MTRWMFVPNYLLGQMFTQELEMPTLADRPDRMLARVVDWRVSVLRTRHMGFLACEEQDRMRFLTQWFNDHSATNPAPREIPDTWEATQDGIRRIRSLSNNVFVDWTLVDGLLHTPIAAGAFMGDGEPAGADRKWLLLSMALPPLPTEWGYAFSDLRR